MESLNIEATKQTPKVSFDPENHIFEIKGESYPENTALFVNPIFVWLKKYLGQLEEDQTFTVNINLTYFNSSSSKKLLDLFEELERAVKKNGKDIIVNWIYDAKDDNTEESGEEFRDGFESLSFNLVKMIH